MVVAKRKYCEHEGCTIKTKKKATLCTKHQRLVRVMNCTKKAQDTGTESVAAAAEVEEGLPTTTTDQSVSSLSSQEDEYPVSPTQFKPLALLLNPTISDPKDRLSPLSTSKKVTQFPPVVINASSSPNTLVPSALPSPTRDIYKLKEKSQPRLSYNIEELQYWLLQESEQSEEADNIADTDIPIPDAANLLEGKAIRDLYQSQMQKQA